jgi:hypothetical protein
MSTPTFNHSNFSSAIEVQALPWKIDFVDSVPLEKFPSNQISFEVLFSA